MPAESKKQQRFFGMVHAVQKGDLSPSEVGPAVRKAAKNTEYSDAKDIASTKHRNLPEKKGSVQMKYFEKIAKDEPGWWAKQTAAGRAARDTGKGINKMITSKEYQKDYYSNMWKGVAPGAAIGVVPGVATGALFAGRFGKKALGVGGAIGALLGADVGATIGAMKGQKKYHAKKGIDISTWGNVKKMTPEAKKKYLSEKYQGGGYKG